MPPIWYDGGDFSLHVYAREAHYRPHLAVRAGRRALGTVSIDTGEVLAGNIPPKMLRRIRQVLAEHPEEAVTAFHAALSHNAVTRLETTRVQTKGESDA